MPLTALGLVGVCDSAAAGVPEGIVIAAVGASRAARELADLKLGGVEWEREGSGGQGHDAHGNGGERHHFAWRKSRSEAEDIVGLMMMLRDKKLEAEKRAENDPIYIYISPFAPHGISTSFWGGCQCPGSSGVEMSSPHRPLVCPEANYPCPGSMSTPS